MSICIDLLERWISLQCDERVPFPQSNRTAEHRWTFLPKKHQQAADFLRVLRHILVMDKPRPRSVGRQYSELESTSKSVNSQQSCIGTSKRPHTHNQIVHWFAVQYCPIYLYNFFTHAAGETEDPLGVPPCLSDYCNLITIWLWSLQQVDLLYKFRVSQILSGFCKPKYKCFEAATGGVAIRGSESFCRNQSPLCLRDLM